VRYFIVGLLFVTTVINYLDRSSISLAGPGITDELHLNSIQMGLVFSAFAWAYSPLQLPGSVLVDRIVPRLLYPVTIFFWSLSATLLGAAGALWQIVALRLGLGAFEAPSFPMNNRIITSWLPEGERAMGVATYVSGQYVGLAFLTPVLVMIQLALGWRGMFVAAGSIGLVWAVCFYAFYRDPARSRRANATELQHIRDGGGKVDWQRRAKRGEQPSAGDVRVGRMFRSRKLWGVLLAHMGETSANWFFLTWFPTYLVRYRHIEFVKVGFMATLPFLAAFAGVLLSGTLSDMLYRRGWSLSFARKTPIVIGLLLAIAIIGANYVDNPAFIIAFMTLAFFGSGLAAISWSVVSSIAPANLVGLASGCFNFIGTSMGIVVPIVIGALVRGGDFAPALVFVGGMASMSVFCWLVVVGRIETIR
jgi:ACS family D-galactonate transporter-like MFS transporter